MPFLSNDEIKKIGFKSYGTNVLISDKASIYSPETISIGSNVRIDDFCIISGAVTLGDYVHISAFSALYGKMGIEIGDFCGLSPRCTVFSASDDFSGEYMISPLVPMQFTNVQGGLVKIEKFVQVGSGCVILPNVTLKQGCAIGSMSLITSNINSWEIHVGIPAKFLKKRKREIIKLASKII